MRQWLLAVALVLLSTTYVGAQNPRCRICGDPYDQAIAQALAYNQQAALLSQQAAQIDLVTPPGVVSQSAFLRSQAAFYSQQAGFSTQQASEIARARSLAQAQRMNYFNPVVVPVAPVVPVVPVYNYAPSPRIFVGPGGVHGQVRVGPLFFGF